MNGQKTLKVVSIFLIIFGVLGTVVYLTGMLGGGLLLAGTALEQLPLAADLGAGVIMLIFAGGLVWAVLELVAGIIGLRNAANPEKASVCFKLGIALLVVTVLSSISQIWMQGFSVMNIASLVIGLILPGLYCYSAKQNMR